VGRPKDIRITIVYDNVAWDKALLPGWGFSCLVETPARTLLFDTGARGEILLGNMEKLNLTPSAIDTVFISHAHWDHTGGLESFLRVHSIPVVVPAFCPVPKHASDVIRVTGSMKIGDGLFSTGLLGGIEQSLVIQTNEQAAVIVGCSHPGVETILARASAIGNVHVLVGGLHGFDAFHAIENLDYVCPAHCTRYIQEIKHRYPEKYIAAGVGKVIALRNRPGSHIVAY
jgi:7,8-dihydropterin-6-yl-methyl-4-(beta-D-ribofuranosyl)aminobenzene 5'-phosphate synthase